MSIDDYALAYATVEACEAGILTAREEIQATFDMLKQQCVPRQRWEGCESVKLRRKRIQALRRRIVALSMGN